LYLLSETRVAAESPAGILPRVRDARAQTLPIREKVLARRLSTPWLIVGFLALMALGTLRVSRSVLTPADRDGGRRGLLSLLAKEE
jgi:hypothetical protein